MTKATAFRFAWMALFGLAGPVSTRGGEAWTDGQAKNIESFLHGAFAQGNAGMVVGLVDERGRKVFSAGRLDNGTGRLVDGETVFEIGSVTKVFTVLLLLDAVRRNELKLEDPLEKFLPHGVAVPSRGGRAITLLNLAAQDSGLPFFPDNLLDKPANELTLQEKKEGSDAYTLDRLYAAVSQFELAQEPGARFEYSNVGMALLGHALERATGRDYESLVVERICRPLGMDSTRITLSADLESRWAAGHLHDGTRAEPWRLTAMAPAGALRSTTNDLLTFLSANLGMVSSELTPSMETMQAVHHTGSPIFGKTAMPWVDERVYNPPGTELWGHAGGGYGTVAFVAFDRMNRRGVVVLTNQMKVPPNGIGWRLLQGMPLVDDNAPIREIVGVGIGLDVDEEVGLPHITTVFPQSPAGQAGLPVGLAIRRIDDAPLHGKSLSECIALLGGRANSKVRLELVGPGQEVTTIELVRQKFLTITDEAAR